MTEQELSVAIRLSAQRALLGAITNNISKITVDWDSLENFTMRVYFDNAPSEDEVEDMEVVTTEILADIPFQSVDKVEIIVAGQEPKNLSQPKATVFLRKS